MPTRLLEAELLYKPLCPLAGWLVGRSVGLLVGRSLGVQLVQFTLLDECWAFGENYLSDLYESWQIYIGDVVKDHKPPCLSVGWSVSYSG